MTSRERLLWCVLTSPLIVVTVIAGALALMGLLLMSAIVAVREHPWAEWLYTRYHSAWGLR